MNKAIKNWVDGSDYDIKTAYVGITKVAKRSDKIKEVVKKLVNSLQNSGIIVDKVILFGSYARGKPKAYSDIDILVVSPSFYGKGILKRQELLGEAIFPLGEPIEALGYTPNEINKPKVLSFLSEILTSGKVIYS